jgi:hypothetical protein
MVITADASDAGKSETTKRSRNHIHEKPETEPCLFLIDDDPLALCGNPAKANQSISTNAISVKKPDGVFLGYRQNVAASQSL